MPLGGYGDTLEATDQIRKICEKLKDQVQNSTNKKFEEFEALQYRTKVVCGYLYLIKVHVGGGSCIHLEVLEKLECHGGDVILEKLQEDRRKEDPIEFLPDECKAPPVFTATLTCDINK